MIALINTVLKRHQHLPWSSYRACRTLKSMGVSKHSLSGKLTIVVSLSWMVITWQPWVHLNFWIFVMVILLPHSYLYWDDNAQKSVCGFKIIAIKWRQFSAPPAYVYIYECVWIYVHAGRGWSLMLCVVLNCSPPYTYHICVYVYMCV